jgi:hypothetical protein
MFFYSSSYPLSNKQMAMFTDKNVLLIDIPMNHFIFYNHMISMKNFFEAMYKNKNQSIKNILESLSRFWAIFFVNTFSFVPDCSIFALANIDFTYVFAYLGFWIFTRWFTSSAT